MVNDGDGRVFEITKFRLSFQNLMVLSTLTNTLSGSLSVVIVDKDMLLISQNNEKSQQQMPCWRAMGLDNHCGWELFIIR
jgi:hypothetical protein